MTKPLKATGSSQSFIRDTFRKVYNDQVNFMSPEIIAYGQHGSYYYELSKGDFLGKMYYGMTVITRTGKRTKLSKGGFISASEAMNYLKNLPRTIRRGPGFSRRGEE